MPSPFVSEDCSFSGRWTGPANGFSYFPEGVLLDSAYQFVPIGQSRTVSVQTDDREWTLSVIGPAGNPGGIEIITNARRAVNSPFEVFTLPPTSGASFEFHASAETRRALVMSTPGEPGHPILCVAAGRSLTVHYAANVILRDAVRKLPYSEPELHGLLGEVEQEYRRQANIRLVRVGPIHRLVFREDNLGSPILANSNETFTIQEHIAAAGRAHLKNLIYGWDFEDPKLKERASGLTGLGRNFSFIDWGNPWMVTAHELGHAICLTDRSASDVTIMQKYRSPELHMGFDGFQIEALRMAAALLP